MKLLKKRLLYPTYLMFFLFISYFFFFSHSAYLSILRYLPMNLHIFSPFNSVLHISLLLANMSSLKIYPNPLRGEKCPRSTEILVIWEKKIHKEKSRIYICESKIFRQKGLFKNLSVLFFPPVLCYFSFPLLSTNAATLATSIHTSYMHTHMRIYKHAYIHTYIHTCILIHK